MTTRLNRAFIEIRNVRTALSSTQSKVRLVNSRLQDGVRMACTSSLVAVSIVSRNHAPERTRSNAHPVMITTGARLRVMALVLPTVVQGLGLRVSPNIFREGNRIRETHLSNGKIQKLLITAVAWRAKTTPHHLRTSNPTLSNASTSRTTCPLVGRAPWWKSRSGTPTPSLFLRVPASAPPAHLVQCLLARSREHEC